MISNVVDLLERMGQDAQLRHAGPGAIERLLADDCIEPTLWSAVMSADPRQLEELAGARANICCMVRAPEDEEDEDGDEDGDEGDGGEDEGDSEEDDKNAASAF